MKNTSLDLVFPAVGGKEVVSRNDGGDITSDAGLLLVSLADQKLGLTLAMAGVIRDRRDQDKVVHGVIEMARERIYAIYRLLCRWTHVLSISGKATAAASMAVCSTRPEVGDILVG